MADTAEREASEKPEQKRAPNAEKLNGNADPAPVDHAHRREEKFEAKEPYRSRKGDRFS